MANIRSSNYAWTSIQAQTFYAGSFEKEVWIDFDWSYSFDSYQVLNESNEQLKWSSNEVLRLIKLAQPCYERFQNLQSSFCNLGQKECWLKYQMGLDSLFLKWNWFLGFQGFNQTLNRLMDGKLEIRFITFQSELGKLQECWKIQAKLFIELQQSEFTFEKLTWLQSVWVGIEIHQ